MLITNPLGPFLLRVGSGATLPPGPFFMPNAVAAPPRLLRLPAVRAVVGLSKSSIYERVKGGRFPKPIPLGSPRVVGWLESDITRWIEAQVAEARSASPAE